MGYAWLPVCHSRSCQQLSLSSPGPNANVGSTADGVRGAKHDRLSPSLPLSLPPSLSLLVHFTFFNLMLLVLEASLISQQLCLISLIKKKIIMSMYSRFATTRTDPYVWRTLNVQLLRLTCFVFSLLVSDKYMYTQYLMWIRHIS